MALRAQRWWVESLSSPCFHLFRVILCRGLEACLFIPSALKGVLSPPCILKLVPHWPFSPRKSRLAVLPLPKW